ncbi:MAG: PAC2 family protein [Nanoarchaeota archaeon]|nr:PAC2 family protein [Nanoarchaeota archaeon]MBU1030693.1 PAC2 family protein [Nanoarchaeota archaeon]MBU1849352.1 PAC2 family protein [Nanoarchaeota archaeon]
MKINLWKKPQGCTIIEGFPGFGLIGTIATEFLLEHMNCEQIGEFVYDELPAMVAIHKGKLVKPMAVYYSKKHNIVILQTILNTKGHEWVIADAIADLAEKLKVKGILSIEGIASPNPSLDETRVYFFGDEKLKSLGLKPVDESIILGVTAAIMLKYDKVTCLFAETHSSLPDSKAAAKIIEILDKYLKLSVNYAPLLKQAEDFENKLKGMLQQGKKAADESDKKYMSYLG